MGGKAEKNKERLHHPELVTFNNKFYSLSFVSESVSSKLKEEKQVYIQERHGDDVVAVPEGIDIYASSQSCEVESMGRGNQILSFQGHP